MLHLAILGSTRGTNMLAIINAIKQKKLAAKIAVVISNKPDALILARAANNNIPAIFVNPTGLTREEYDQQVLAVLREYKIDMIILIGYMRILSADFIAVWKNKIINIHPSLLPAFAGKMDLDVHRAVLASGVTETGCTVHFVTELVDDGPILLQKKCPVFPQDTPESLKERVQQLEGEAFIAGLNAVIKT